MPRLVAVSRTTTGTVPGDDGACEPPDIRSFAARVYGNMEPIANLDRLYCWHFMRFIGALGEIFQEADDIARPDNGGPPWAGMVDINYCPNYALKWLAQFVGTRVPPKYDVYEQRNYIRSTPNWKRGTPAAIKGATKIHLTGTQAVYLDERWCPPTSTDPLVCAYWLQVSTLVSETPDPDETLNDILTQKPAGIMIHYRTVLGQTYQHLYETSADYNVVYSKYATYQGVFDDVPGE